MTYFFASADLGRLVTLDYRYGGTGANAIEPILASDRLSGVRCLILRGCILGVEGVALLAASRLLRGCRSLEMHGTASSGPGVMELIRSPGVGGLEDLSLWCSEPRDQLLALAASPYLANLRRLTVGGGPIPDMTVHALATSPHLTKLTDLSMRTRWDSEAVPMIIGESETLIHLRRLELNNTVESHSILARLAERRRERGIE